MKKLAKKPKFSILSKNREIKKNTKNAIFKKIAFFALFASFLIIKKPKKFVHEKTRKKTKICKIFDFKQKPRN